MKVPKPRNVAVALALIAILLAVALGLAQDQETLRVKTDLAADDPRFPAYLARLLGNPLTTGDAVVVHTNGPDAFPAMLAAIASARHRVSFETYIYDTGEVAGMFNAAFEAAARRGVSVHLVLDSVGSKGMEESAIERLERAGVRIGWFNRLASYSIEEANYRTHRKILVVDGRVAFVGGLGIADQWLRDSGKLHRWRDTHVELRGPVAANIEGGFSENWIETGGVVEPDVPLEPAASEGSAQSIVVWSSPEGGANDMKLLYLLAIAAARRSIDIQSPYLITDESTLWSLQQARARGVRIRMLVEGDLTDAKPVKFAGRAEYGKLLASGIDVFEYQPSMMHTKAVIVDGILSIVGSANFDNRSLELNDELNVAVFDSAVAARLTTDFESDTKASAKLDLDAWRSRPPHIRAREWVWSYFGEIF